MTSSAGSITLALRTAQSGLLTNQQILNTVANNVANANTPGYSRKVAHTEQRVLSGIGSGVQLGEVSRRVDEGLLNSLRQQLSEISTYSVQDSYYSRMQQLFGTPEDNTSLAHILGDFTSAIETLAVSPNQTLEQSDVVRRGTEVAQMLRDMTDIIQDLRLQADRDIGSVIDQINDHLVNIADLNDKIVRNRSINADVTDLQDQRDGALDSLSSLMDIRYFYNADGDVIVFSAEGKTLVSNVAATVSHSIAGAVASTTTHAEGDFGAILVSNGTSDISSQQDITEEISTGQLRGLIDLRDDVLYNIQSQLDELGGKLRDVFNQIHNRGVSFPGAQEMTGTRAFIDSSSQAITFVDNSDTRMTLFDSDGNQTATTTIRALLGGRTGTIDAIATAMETWLQANGCATANVGMDSENKFSIELNSTSRYLGFRDEDAANTLGSAQQDASIAFNSDGVAGTGETYNAVAGNDELVSGFSNFFGLNDFFVDGQPANIHDSNVVSSFAATAASLRFTDANGALAGSPVAIASGDSLQTIADKINAALTNATASVIPDGSGFRLRISHDDGISLVVTQATGNTLLTDLGLHKSNVRTASAIDVRSDIVSTPALIARGNMQWDADLGAAGKYYVSGGDGSNVDDLAAAFTSTNSFSQAGGIPNKTIAFSDYAAAIIGQNSSLASSNANKLEFNQNLGDSLQIKSDSYRGVNLDEEMSNLILFEQAYSASARVMTVIQNMFDALERII